MTESYSTPETGPESFWHTASQNVLLMERANPDLVIGLAHGGILPARATKTAWEGLLDRSFPPLLLANIGSEKRQRYREFIRNEVGRYEFYGTYSPTDEVVHFFNWLQGQKDWQEELRAQITQTLGSPKPPESIVVIDEMMAEGNTMLLSLGLLEILYPHSKNLFLDGPYFEWRTTMSRRWMQTFHPHLLAKFDNSNQDIPYQRSLAPYRIAAGTEDVEPERMSLRPLSLQNPHLAELKPFLPATDWMQMPGWITQVVLTYVADQAEQTNLESVRYRNAYVLEREGNGLETYLLLAHIRRWGSISITEACQLLGISPTTAQELLDWLVRRVEVEARWGVPRHWIRLVIVRGESTSHKQTRRQSLLSRGCGVAKSRRSATQPKNTTRDDTSLPDNPFVHHTARVKMSAQPQILSHQGDSL